MLYRFLRTVLPPLFRIIYRLELRGVENLPSEGPTVIVANHLSFIDSLFLPVALTDRRLTFLAKVGYFNNPRLAWFFRALGQIPCDRSEGGGKSALEAARVELRRGRTVAIYPEGTRSRDGVLHRGHTGAARLAAATGAAVVPCGIRGTDLVMPIGTKRPRLKGRMKVEISFGKPVLVRKLAGPDADLAVRPITDLLMQRIAKESGQRYVDSYAGSVEHIRETRGNMLDSEAPRTDYERREHDLNAAASS